MFGPAGFLYVYFVYGMHWCCNVVCGPDGEPSAVLLRAGRVVAGEELARARRPAARSATELARGPARLASTLGLVGTDTGADLLDPASPIRLLAGTPVPDAAVRARPAGRRRGRRRGPVADLGRRRPDGQRRTARHPPPRAADRPRRLSPPASRGRTADSYRDRDHLDAAGVTVDDLPPHLREAHDRLAFGAAEVLPADGLAERLLAAEREGRPLRVKLGIDPSGADLTLGHAVVLRKLRQFQDLGHTAVLIVGGFTGRVGDPSGRTNTRAALTAEQTAQNSRRYFEQLMRVLDPDRVEVRDNAEWLDPMTMAEIMSYAREVTVARLLERDDFARRHREHLPISLVEFFYPLLQGIDSVAVRSDVELGGTDQTFNNLMGRDLQRAHGQPPQAVLTVPLLVGTDGVEKMGKSLGNWIGIEEPADEQFGKVMSIPDSVIGHYATLATDLPPAEVAEIERDAAAGGPAANRAKRRVAAAVVELYHGRDGGRGGRAPVRHRAPPARGARRRAGAAAASRRPGAPAGAAGRARLREVQQRRPPAGRRRRGPAGRRPPAGPGVRPRPRPAGRARARRRPAEPGPAHRLTPRRSPVRAAGGPDLGPPDTAGNVVAGRGNPTGRSHRGPTAGTPERAGRQQQVSLIPGQRPDLTSRRPEPDEGNIRRRSSVGSAGLMLVSGADPPLW